MSNRLKLLLIILVIFIAVPILYIRGTISKHCVQVASKATCKKLSLRDQITIYAGRKGSE
ncbi:MAG: hypothetical protein KW802_00015 [Candidatus Doudnabacteria bacterium]|nr:hypothetical protein [Candidatus Doudnabacteria bacterium]